MMRVVTAARDLAVPIDSRCLATNFFRFDLVSLWGLSRSAWDQSQADAQENR